MPNYNKGKIYRLQHQDKFYIGSTCLLLCQRKAKHKQVMNKRKSSLYSYLKTVDWNDVSIVLIENYSCNSKEELFTRESYYIELYKTDRNCLNHRVAIPTNKSIQQQLQKDKKHKSDKITCECGAEIARGYKHQHILTKTHCEALGLEYIPTEIRSEESKKKQKENASRREKELVVCECGSTVKRGSLYLHRKSIQHTTKIESLTT